MKHSLINFDTIYDQYYTDVFRFSYWLSGNHDDGKDIASETFIRLWTANSEIKTETIKAYLFTIARNIYLQGKRKMKPQAALSNDLVDNSPNSDQITQSGKELSAVIKQLQSLPELDKTILIMKAYEGLSYKEISSSLNISIPSIKIRVHRARVQLALARED